MIKRCNWRLLVAAVVYAAGLISAPVSDAASVYYDEWGISLGARAGKIISACDKNYPFGTTAWDDISIEGADGWFMEVEIDKKINDNFSVGIETGQTTYELDFTVNPIGARGISGGFGKIDAVPFLGHAKVQFSIDKFSSFSARKFTLTPYVKLGIGGLFVDFQEDDYAVSQGFALNTQSSALVFKYGAGFDLFFTDSLAVNLDASYIDSDLKTQLSWPHVTTDDDVSQNSWMLGGGLRYVF